jgi:hypothetical protein
MKPEVWVPSLAALLAPLVPLVISGISDRKRSQPGAPFRRSTSHRVRWSAVVLSAASVAMLVVLAPAHWRWLVLGGYLALGALAYALVVHRSRSRVRLFPETDKFLKLWKRKTAGFPYDRDFLPDLIRVYTKNGLEGSGDASVPSGFRRSKEPASVQPTSFERLLTDPKVRHIAITGEAGTGKTSLLEFWNHDLLTRVPSPREGLSRFVPLLLAARDLVGCSSIAEVFGTKGAEVLSRPPGDGMNWLIMIDAFDEITDAEARAEVERVVFAAIDESPAKGTHPKFVITSRGLSDDRRRSFDTRGVAAYQLQPFTLGQLREFLIREETSARDINARNDAFRAAAAKIDRFLSRWEGHDELLDLIRLPLLARVTASIYFQDQELQIPARRIDIYHDAIEHWISQFHKRMRSGGDQSAPALRLLHEWHGGQGGPNPPDTDAAIRELLRRLAVSYLESDQRSVVSLARTILAVPFRPKEATHALLTLLEATGLVHDVRAIDPQFLHKSYAEYLAAPFLFDRGEDLVRWDETLRDPDRRIGAVFCLAQMDFDRRRDLIDRLAADGRFPLSCGWIAVEGLCVDGGSGGIDDEQRDRLVDNCVQAMPPLPTSEWWILIRALSVIESARDRFIAIIQEHRIADYTVLDLCREVAKHDPRGVALLRRIATSAEFARLARIFAADYLADHEPGSALPLLRGFVTDPNAPDLSRAQALRWLSARVVKADVRLIRIFAGGPMFDAPARVEAALLLALHAPRRGVRLAVRYANDRGIEAGARVDLAEQLAELKHPQGLDVLRRIAADPAFEDIVRVSAADRLTAFDRDTGLERLREFSADPARDHPARVEATYRLALHEGRSSAEAMIAFAEDAGLTDEARLLAVQLLDDEAGQTKRRLAESFAALTTLSDTARVAAIEILFAFDRPAARRRLEAIVADTGTEDYARVYAANCLAGRNPEAGMPLVAKLAADPMLSDGAHVYANQSLYEKGDFTGLTTLIRFAGDREREGAARVAAAAFWARIDRAQAAKVLRTLAKDLWLSHEDRVAALVARIQTSRRAGPAALRIAAGHEKFDAAARVAAAKALVAFQLPEAVEFLVALNANAEFGDHERFEAAKCLVDVERDVGLRLVHDMALDEDTVENVRRKALQTLAVCRPDVGMPLVRTYAADRSLPGSIAMSAAFWLAVRSPAEGTALLNEFVDDARFDDQARVDAAQCLVDFERERGLDLLRAFGDDARLDDYARAGALAELARHDRSAGVTRMRQCIEHGRPLLSVLAAGALAPYDSAAALPVLRLGARGGEADPEARVWAAEALSRFDRAAGVAALREITNGEPLPDATRVAAAGVLLPFDRLAAYVYLWEKSDDPDADGTVRAVAAGSLAVASTLKSLELLRGLVADDTVDAIGRGTAAWLLSCRRKGEGIRAMAEVRADPAADEAARCWIDVHAAERSPEARAALPESYAHLAEGDLVRLTAAARTLRGSYPRSGCQVTATVAAIAREARATG